MVLQAISIELQTTHLNNFYIRYSLSFNSDEEDQQTARNCGYADLVDTDECDSNPDGVLCVCTTDYCNGATGSEAFSGVVAVALFVSVLSYIGGK